MSLQRICRPYRSLVRLATVLLLVLAGTLFSACAADAGGPTSALVVSPSNDSAAAVYYSDPEYDNLLSLLGGSSWPAPQPRRRSPPTGTTSP